MPIYSLFFAALIATAEPFSYPQALSSTSMVARELVEVDLLKLYKEESKTPSDIKEKNDRLVQELLSTPATKEGISESQASEILKMFRNHPVISEEATAKYDTELRQIGYCFGRAAFVHWELLRRGVKPTNIGKIFAIGKFNYQGALWDFHVATVVRNLDGDWLVIDGFQNRVMKPDVWTEQISKWSLNNALYGVRFYFTDPVKFRPLPGAYSEKNLNDVHYKNYFKDLIQWFNDRPATTESEKFIKAVTDLSRKKNVRGLG